MVRRIARMVSAGLAAAAGLACLGCPASTPLPDLGGREVKVAVDKGYPPFSSINPQSGEAEGWDYDAIDEIARRLNFVPVYVEVPFDEVIGAVSAGIYDMAGDGIVLTYSRIDQVDYSRQYAVVRQRVALRGDETRFRTLVDLKADPAVLIGAEAGSANHEAATAYFGADRVRAYPGFEATLIALGNHEVDGIAMDDIAYRAQLQAVPGSLSQVAGVLYGNLLGFIFPKGSDLVEPVNQAITAMERDGTLQSLNGKWFSRTD